MLVSFVLILLYKQSENDAEKTQETFNESKRKHRVQE